MSNSIIYTFGKIDNSLEEEFTVTYSQDGFSFHTDPYFTAIFTLFDGTNYDSVKTRNGIVVTLSSIQVMIEEYGIAVNLVVIGKEKARLILPLTKFDNNYAYFSNGELSLKVDSNGAVTEASINPVE